RVEFLEPDGSGPVANAISRRGAHLFAAGLSTGNFDGLAAHLESAGIPATRESGQLFLNGANTGGFGLQVVISLEESLPAIGALDFFYETTLLVDDARSRVQQCADIFDLDTGPFVPIDSDNYGYDGTLTLFRENRLDRFEIITPNNPENTMGRYFKKFGEGYYMAFAESDQLVDIEQKAREAGLGHTPVRPNDRPEGQTADTVFLHPPTLGGMMLGISRPTMAWSWSGQPDKVEAPA
ncbi:MAG: hypothetical protein HUJ31_05580, partial [Pseudomonadales bacterium]|nr:hypothetical protein [Pseudomonadales bacterium]